MPSKSLVPMLVLGWAAVMLVSGAVFWLLLRDGGNDEAHPTARPARPEVDPPPQPLTGPTATMPRRSRVGIEAEIAQLEKVISLQKEQEIAQNKQREILASTIKRYVDLVANGDPKMEGEAAFFRKKSAELGVKLEEIKAAISDEETQRTAIRTKLKQAGDELRVQKQALDTEVGTLATARAVSALQNQLATLDCKIAADKDGLAWCNIQQTTLLKLLSGQKEEILPVVETLEKWQPPREGIAVLESQLTQLRSERDLLLPK